MLCASCLPLLYCTTELYTDAFSLAFPLIAIYCFCRLTDAGDLKSSALWAVAFAFASFIGAQIRFTSIIASIACLIVLAFEKRGRALVLAGVLLAAVMLSGNAAVDAYTVKSRPNRGEYCFYTFFINNI